MKQLLILLILISGSTTAFAQHVQVEFSSNSWAGGVCCTSGKDYRVIVKIKGSPKDCFDAVKLTVNDTADYLLSDLDFRYISYGDTLHYFMVGFGTVTNDNGFNDIEIGGRSNYHGPEVLRNFQWDDGFPNPNKKMKITLIREGQETVYDEVKITETFTAYP